MGIGGSPPAVGSPFAPYPHRPTPLDSSAGLSRLSFPAGLLLRLCLPRLRRRLAGLPGPCHSLCGGHRLERPLPTDASTLGALLLEERENVSRQFLHPRILTPLWWRYADYSLHL